MSGDTGLKPGEVYWVIGVKDAYHAATGCLDFNSRDARKWFNERGYSVFKLERPIDETAVDREDP